MVPGRRFSKVFVDGHEDRTPKFEVCTRHHAHSPASLVCVASAPLSFALGMLSQVCLLGQFLRAAKLMEVRGERREETIYGE